MILLYGRQEVADLFEPSIDAAVNSIRKQAESARGVVKAVWLVGGFAASPWLFSQLQARLAPLGITVNRPDTQTWVFIFIFIVHEQYTTRSQFFPLLLPWFPFCYLPIAEC